ncbi:MULTISPECIES: glycosyltransferase [unclassified Caballeronia]|jgi:glycosyltransferase involved in cell wall biosynthesis|uniref:glycosyltransferase family 2 protein n=1 Tax=unclassified Caballeronia TaxID=2646786 RepID=UPI0020295B62|nr:MULTISPECIES: glycosyltransferase [unclassified Caballeronia]
MFKFLKKNEGPSISVVVPLYNHGRYIKSTLESVLEQTSPADEIVLIDDGSSDNGFEIAERVLAKTPRARTFRQENAGAHNTINRAIGVSRSQYVAVLNSDDLFAPKKLERCRELIAQRGAADLIAGGVGIMDDDGARQRGGVAVDWLARSKSFLDKYGLPQLSLVNENYVATTSNMVFSRRLWEASGGFQPLRYCHDLDFLMFAFEFGSVILDLDEEHIVYRVHQGNTIKEDLSRVRVEIAAVIADALHQSGPRLLSPEFGERDFEAFTAVLRNKQMSDMLCFFQTVRPAFATRTAFYEYANDAKRAAVFRQSVSPA